MKNQIDELLNPKVMDLSIPYYDDYSRISNSSLGWFMISPIYFRKMMDGEGIKLEGKFLQKGSRIHKYILEPDTFWKEYRISTVTQPSSKNQNTFCEEYVRLIKRGSEHNTACLSAFKESYSTKGKTEDKMLSEGLEMADNLKNYIEELKNNDEREVMTFNDLNELKEIKKNIDDHILASHLVDTSLFPNRTDKLETYSEFHINWIHESGVECKSLLDRLIIDPDNKRILLVDLKTTAKIHSFEDSILEYGYYRQMAYYWKAITWYFKNVRKEDISEYSKETYIVGISTNDITKNEIRVFEIQEDKIKIYSELIDSLLEEIKWHIDKNTFGHSKEYYLNNGQDNILNKWKMAS